MFIFGGLRKSSVKIKAFLSEISEFLSYKLVFLEGPPHHQSSVDKMRNLTITHTVSVQNGALRGK